MEYNYVSKFSLNHDIMVVTRAYKWLIICILALGAFSTNAQTWQQIGNSVGGESNSDKFGGAVSISADGITMAAGAINDDDGGSNAGHVRVYELVGLNWVQKGADLDGNLANADFFGTSVALNDNGTVVVAGGIQNRPGPGAKNDPEGYVRVYSWDGAAWNQMGRTSSVQIPMTVLDPL